ncbi:hypothetical protein Mal52_59190 [Symmachiella dynata]|uniref:Uncharacterized protein n=1 Tax=Symmachiella dynata TaxID=2527995 RepID=A0A517ZY42_9PLAN|nr:hypothetical protein [Symmachiella dynata]QDU47389.1 hypothetical protein Mal52_59190 [Symmachiella dynata]
MRQCHSCGHLLSVHSPVCVSCHAPVTTHDAETAPSDLESHEETRNTSTGNLVAVARFSNSAEAGYFADDLEHSAQIESRLIIQEQFDALTGRWRHDYVLQVDESQAENATAYLNARVSDSPEDEYERIDPLTALPSTMPATGLNWIPILLTTLAAGSMAYWGVKKIEERPQPPALGNQHPQRVDDLWKAVVNADGPWIQQIGNGPGIRVMRADANGRIVIQEDRDGDRQIDHEFRLRR